VRFLYLIFFLFLVVASYAQSITGTVRDKVKNEAIGYASIRILHPKDSTYISGAITSSEGIFRIKQPQGNYILEVSFMGYQKYKESFDITEKKPDVDLGTIYLSEANIELVEAVVYAPVPDIVVRGDTIEYNADGYKVEADALLQDLIQKIPGIEISSNGKLMANGKPISKILVDGKEFFGNDIDLALKNLPASMVNKLQLFKEQSETSKITGFKDGNPEQVLNLTVKEGLKKSVFGNAQIGYGTDERYANRANAHYMIDDNQYSVIANMNNITDNFEYSGGSGQYDGITKNKKIGFNFSAQSNEKLKVGGNIRYENNSNLFEMGSSTQTFIESGNRLSEQSSSTNGIKKDLGLGLNMKWTPDSLTTIYARINTSIGNSEDIRNGTNKSYVQNQKDTTSGWSRFITDGDTHNLNASVVFGRKLNDKGRTLSFTLNGGYRKGNSSGTNYSLTTYQSLQQPKIIDQELDIKNDGNNWGFLASYVEPVGKNNLLQFSYSIRQDYADRDRNTYKKDIEGEYSVIDTAYTRKTITKYTSQRISLGFQSIREKYEYTVGFNFDPTRSSSLTNMRDSIIEDQHQQVVNFSPTLKFTYTPKNNITFDFDYYGTSGQPTLKQLSADTTIIDALSTTYGNPGLKPSFDNNVSMYFQKSNYEKGSFFMISMGGNYIVNKIVDYTTIDKDGNTQSTYRNINGNWGLNGGIMFNTPLRNKKFTVDNSSFAYLTRNIGYSNGIKNVTKNLALNETFSINYKGEKLNQRLQLNLACNLTQNNLPNQAGLNTANYGFKSSTMIKLPYNISIQNEMSYTYNYGYAKEFKNTEFLWNASVAMQFLKKKQATVRVQCYDLLNDRNNVMRVVTGNYISDTRTNMIGRYFLFSLNYRFNVLKGGSAENSDSGGSYIDY
jgi:hypothetical protein